MCVLMLVNSRIRFAVACRLVLGVKLDQILALALLKSEMRFAVVVSRLVL